MTAKNKAIPIIVISATVFILLGGMIVLFLSKPVSIPTVAEVAPGIFTRHGFANQSFVIFDEYVVVFDPGHAEEAPGLMAEIRARTKHPVRYVICSHFHPDHAAGASAFEREGAVVIAASSGEFDYEGWARHLFERRMKNGEAGYHKGLNYPSFKYINQTMILDDGQQLLEIRQFGHGHTKGDLVAWLPKHRIVMTGDVANSGQLNLANGDLASWIKVLEKISDLSPKIVVPGHGALGGPDILTKNRRFLIELLDKVGKMVGRGMDLDDVLGEITIPFYEEWTGHAVNEDPNNVRRAYVEVGGKLKDSDNKLFFLKKVLSKIKAKLYR